MASSSPQWEVDISAVISVLTLAASALPTVSSDVAMLVQLWITKQPLTDAQRATLVSEYQAAIAAALAPLPAPGSAGTLASVGSATQLTTGV